MKVEWTGNAIAQLKSIHDYIALDSDVFAKRMVDRLTLRSIQIQDHPFSGQVVPEFGNESIREFIEGPFRVIYQPTESVLFVLAVIHGARLLTENSLKEQ